MNSRFKPGNKIRFNSIYTQKDIENMCRRIGAPHLKKNEIYALTKIYDEHCELKNYIYKLEWFELVEEKNTLIKII